MTERLTRAEREEIRARYQGRFDPSGLEIEHLLADLERAEAAVLHVPDRICDDKACDEKFCPFPLCGASDWPGPFKHAPGCLRAALEKERAG